MWYSFLSWFDRLKLVLLCQMIRWLLAALYTQVCPDFLYAGSPALRHSLWSGGGVASVRLITSVVWPCFSTLRHCTFKLWRHLLSQLLLLRGSEGCWGQAACKLDWKVWFKSKVLPDIAIQILYRTLLPVEKNCAWSPTIHESLLQKSLISVVSLSNTNWRYLQSSFVLPAPLVAMMFIWMFIWGLHH